MKEVYEFLKSCGVYYLATVEGKCPFGTVDLFENKLYIQTGKVKAVAQICSFMEAPRQIAF